MSSSEVSDTTADDPLTSVECYASIEDAATALHGQDYTNIIAAGDTGIVNSANKLTTARTITLTGVVSGSASFDGSGDVSIITSSDYKLLYSTKFYPGTTQTITQSVTALTQYKTVVIHAMIGDYEQQFVFRKTTSQVKQGFSYYKSADYNICGVISVNFSTGNIIVTVENKTGYTNADNCYISEIYGSKM